MSEERIADPNSLGLLGMQERAGILGGKVAFRRNRRGGTTVIVNLPLPDMPPLVEEPVVFHPTFVEPESNQTAA
jgi:signal transduction histidine kinase